MSAKSPFSQALISELSAILRTHNIELVSVALDSSRIHKANGSLLIGESVTAYVLHHAVRPISVVLLSKLNKISQLEIDALDAKLVANDIKSAVGGSKLSVFDR